MCAQYYVRAKEGMRTVRASVTPGGRVRSATYRRMNAKIPRAQETASVSVESVCAHQALLAQAAT